MNAEQNAEQLEAIRATISDSIDRSVNGKINKLTQKFDDYVVDDTLWKKEYEPYLKGLANLSISAKFLVFFSMGISAILGVVIAVKNLIR